MRRTHVLLSQHACAPSVRSGIDNSSVQATNPTARSPAPAMLQIDVRMLISFSHLFSLLCVTTTMIHINPSETCCRVQEQWQFQAVANRLHARRERPHTTDCTYKSVADQSHCPATSRGGSSPAIHGIGTNVGSNSCASTIQRFQMQPAFYLSTAHVRNCLSPAVHCFAP